MYRDVGKRILAMMVALCMVLGLMPETMLAAEVKSYHTYQHGSGSSSGYADTKTVAAVFTVGENSSGGAEILDSISFNAHVNEEGKAARATVSYYINPTEGDPASGTYVCAKPIDALQEGLNSVEIGMQSQEMKAGDTFSAVISLEGASVAYYGNAAAGQTYVSVNGSWQDAAAAGQCLAIRAYTYDVGDNGEEKRPWLEQITSVFSGKDSSDETDIAVMALASASLNKTSMTMAVGDATGDITLNGAAGAVAWSVADTSIAEVLGYGTNNASAHVKGVAKGETTITASYGGNTYTCALTVTDSIADATITLSSESDTYDGKPHAPSLIVKIGDKTLKENDDYQVSCKCVETGTAISSFTFKDAGTYQFTVSGQNNITGTKTIEYKILPKQITDETIEVTLAQWDATNSQTQLAYVSKVTDTAEGASVLTKGTETTGDYYLQIGTNEAGETGIQIIGRGNYTGTRFCAAPKDLSHAQITFDKESYIYLGTEWCPQVTVTLDGVTLSSDSYTLTYANNKEASVSNNATVTVEGKTDKGYYGTKTAEFTILQKDIANADQNSIHTQVTVEVSNAPSVNDKPGVVVTYNGMTLIENTDYTLSIPNANAITGNTSVCTITGQGNYKGEYRANYTIASNDINTFADGIQFTSTGSGTISVPYTGQAQKPALVLTKNGQIVTALKEGTDYSVNYTNNVNAGTAIVTVKGMGAYGGTLKNLTTSTNSFNFTITQEDISNMLYWFADADGNAVSTSNYSVPYSVNIADMQPKVIIKNSTGTMLKEGEDYELVYSLTSASVTTSPDLTAQSWTVTVQPKGSNYDSSTSKVLNYSVQKCNLKTAVANGDIIAELDKETFAYISGTAQQPTPTLYYKSDRVKTLTAGTDYKVGTSEPNPTAPGEYKLTITGIGNYSGTLEYSFKINAIDISTSNKIVIAPDTTNTTGLDTTWTGNNKHRALVWFDSNKENNKLKLIITDNSAGTAYTLKEGTASAQRDYTLSYENIDAVSTSEKYAKVTITGHGAYTGEYTIFYLLAGDLGDYTVSADSTGITYTGEAIQLAKENITVKTGYLWWKSELEQGEDYKLTYTNNTNATSAGNLAGFTVEQMADDKLPTKNGCYRYKPTSAKLTGEFEIAKKDIADTAAVQLEEAIIKEYDGTVNVTLGGNDIKLVYNGKSLSENTDFSIDISSYADNNKAGTASVRINGNGNYTGTREIEFTITGKSFDGVTAVVANPEDAVYIGASLYPELTLKAEDGTLLTKDTDYTYEKSDYTDNKNAGTASVTVHGKGKYSGSTAAFTFTIVPRDISKTDAYGGSCIITGIQAQYTYTSQPIEPNINLQFQATGAGTRNTLVKGTDYAVSFTDNVDAKTVSSKKASISITGIGNYTGTYTKEVFEIVPKSILNTETDITVASIPSQEFIGGVAAKPVPDITYKYGSSASDVYQLGGADYTLAYVNENQIGTAKLTITGTGNFTGSRDVDYHIGTTITNQQKVSVTCADSGKSFVYTGKAYEPAVVVKDLTTNTVLIKDTDYKVSYKNHIDVGTASVSVEGIGGYAGTVDFTFTITPKNLADSDVVLTVEGKPAGSYQTSYAGTTIKPQVTLTYNGNSVAAAQYSVSYGGSNPNAGWSNIIVTAAANSNFTGTKTVQNAFEITPVSIGSGAAPASGFTLDAIGNQSLGTSGVAAPTPKLYFNGAVLTAGADYTYSYQNNTAAGTAYVILTGTGNYAGSIRQAFTICKGIDEADVTVIVPTQVWYRDYVQNGKVEFDTLIHVFYPDGQGGTIQLNQGTDYDITYDNNEWLGTAAVTLKGKGQYAGTVEKKVQICADFDNAAERQNITITVPDQKYTGTAVTPVPYVEYYGKNLTEGVHFYKSSYSNNINISNMGAVLEVRGMGVCTGTLTANFSITQNAGALRVSGVAASYKYSGKPIKPAIVVKMGNTTLNPNTDYDVIYGTNTNAGINGTVQVNGKGNYAGFNSEMISFAIEPLDINDIIVSDGTNGGIADKEYTGEAITPTLTLSYKDGSTTYTLPQSDYQLSYADNVNAGSAKVSIQGTTNSSMTQNITGTRVVTFNILPKSLAKPASGTDTISMALAQTSFAYDGTAKTPGVTVTHQSSTGTRTLAENADYTVDYKDNVTAGTATVTVTGMGNYANSRDAQFTIGKQDISAATVTLTNGYVYPYMGSAVEPEIVVTANSVKLTEDIDYTVTYQDNTACGTNTASVTITGKGGFAGTKTVLFSIEPHSINAADVTVAPIPNQSYTGSPVVPELTITCGSYQLVKGVDFEVSCTNNTQLGTASVIIKGINGFKDSRTGSFNIASGIEKAEVKGLKTSYPYTGQILTAVELGITEVRIGTTVLTANDYTVGFAQGSDGMSAGTQTVVLTGTGNYGGSKEFTITIIPKDIAETDVVLAGFADTLPYAQRLEQKITLTWGVMTLQKGTDYEVACSSTQTAGTYVMTVTGKGNYTGTLEKNYKVEQAAADNLEVKDISSSYTYNGKAIEPKPTVMLGKDKLKEGEDYTLTYQNNVNAGQAAVTITGTGTRFTGEKKLVYTILSRSINYSKASEIADQIYTGKDVKPVVTLTDGGSELVENVDYTLGYKSNRRAGRAYVVVGGKGNYTSTKPIEFNIRPCTVTSAAVTGVSQTAVTLSWKGEGVVSGYEVYRMEAGGTQKLVGATTSTNYTDMKLAAGKNYSYQIRSYVVGDNGTSYGDFSSVVTAATTK